MSMDTLDDLIFEGLEHANKPKEKKMNILIQNIDRETVELVNTLIDSENTKRKVEKGMREALDEQQKAETMEGLKNIVGDIGTLMERIYKAKPEWRPIEDRKFNEDAIDREYDRIQDQEQRWGEERDDDIERQEEFEANL